MTGGTTDDDVRWTLAQSILRDAPSEDAEARLRQVRRTRILLVVAATVLVAALAVVFGLLVLDLADGDVSRDDGPAWAGAVGAVLSILGGLLMVVGGVLLLRSMRRTRPWRRSLDVLTFRQRRELLHQVRGRSPLSRERIPLVRAQAEVLVDQRAPVVVTAAVTLNFVGITLRDPEPWALVISVLGGVMVVGAVVQSRRDLVRARRFLQQHPAQEQVP